MYCLINVNKLKDLKYGSYAAKIAVIEKNLRGVQTSFRVRTGSAEYTSEGSITEGILFFRAHDIDDNFIYELLSQYEQNR